MADDFNNEEEEVIEEGDDLDVTSVSYMAGEARRVIGEVQNIFTSEGESFDEGDESNLVGYPPDEPEFPFIILGIAITKDILDIFDTFFAFNIESPITSILAVIIAFIVSIGCATILFLWFFNKMNGAWWKAKIMNALWGGAWGWYLGVEIAELMPILQLLPMSSIFVLMIYYKELKIVRLLNLALEEFHKAGLIKYLE